MDSSSRWRVRSRRSARRPVHALEAVRGADLVLCCVKSTDTEAVAREMAPSLEPHAAMLSLQNGVDNAATMARQCSTRRAGGRVRRHRDARARVRAALRSRRPGDRPDSTAGGSRCRAVADMLQDLVDLFASADVPVPMSADVHAELWSKLLVNCAYNAISGLAQLPYGKTGGAARDRADTAMRSCTRWWRWRTAEGVALPLPASLEAMERIATAMPAQFSSTAQDMARGKPSEIDHLNGSSRGAAPSWASPRR